MTLIVDLVRAPRRSVATVRLRVTVPAGQVTIMGETARESWTVGTYISTGEPRVLADPLAPIGEQITYRAARAGTIETVTITRPSPGECAISSLDGTLDALTSWYGDDPQEPDLRVHELVVPGASLPIHNHDVAVGAGGGALEAHTEGPHTAALARLIASPAPAVLLHDGASCQIPGCDIPAARVVTLTGASTARLGSTTRAVRAHALTYRYARRDPAALAPVVTVGDYQWSGLDNSNIEGYTVVDVAAGVPLVTVL